MLNATHQALTYRNSFFCHTLFNHELWWSKMDSILLCPEPQKTSLVILMFDQIYWCRTHPTCPWAKNICSNSAGCFNRQLTSGWSHVLIFQNNQGKEGVGDTVSKSVELEYKVEVDQLGTPFHVHNCMVVESLKWEKEEEVVKKQYFLYACIF